MPDSFIPPIELQITLDIDNLLTQLEAAKSAIQAFRDDIDTTAIRLPVDIRTAEGLAVFKTFIKTVQTYANAHPIKVPVVFTTPIGPFATSLAEARAAATAASAAQEAAPAAEEAPASSGGFWKPFLGNMFGSLFGSWGSKKDNLLNALGTRTAKEGRNFLGLPGFKFGTLGALAGFGPERFLTTGLGTAGTALAGLLGGGTLLGASAATVGAVGMGTDMAGIGQAVGDIKNTYQALTNLNQAIQIYGKNSYQARVAQAQLNATLNSFSAAARPAVLHTSELALQFHNLFDAATGVAEAGGARIIGGLIKAAEPALPVIGTFAAQNMGIVQKGLNPFEGWLDNKGSQGGLGIFTNLERIFQHKLPYAVQAGTQAFELFAKTVNYVASNFGGKLLPYLARFFTHINNSKTAMEQWHHIIRELVNDFFDVWDVVKNLIKVLGSLFAVFQGAGATVLQILAQILASLAKWLSTSGKGAATLMFGAHEDQLKQIGKIIVSLMPILEAGANGFMVLEGAVSSAVTPLLKLIAAIVGFISHLVQSHGIIGRITRDFIGFAGGTAIAIFAIRRFVSYLNIMKRVENVVKGVSDVFKGVSDVIKGVGDYITYARVLASEFADKFKSAFSDVVKYAKNFASGVGNAFNSVRSFLGNFISTIGNVAKSVWSFVSSAISNVINLAKTWISNIVEMVTSSEMFGPMMFGILAVVVVVAILIITHWKTVKRWAIEIWHFIANLVVQIWHQIYAVIGNYLHTIAAIWSTAWQLIVDIFTGKFSQIPKLGERLLHDFVALFENQLAALGNLAGKMIDIGKRIVEGLVHGLMSGISWIGHAISSIGSSILGGIKKIFGIFSPSREMAKVGNYLMLGLAQGITDGTTHAISAMTGASAQIMGRSRAALTTGAMGMGRTAGGLSGGITMNVEAHFTINAPGGEPGAIRRAIGDAATEFSHQVLVSMRAGAGRLY